MVDDNIRNSVVDMLVNKKALSGNPIEEQLEPTSSQTKYHGNKIIEQEVEQSDELIEQLADYAHTAWSGWMEYLFGKSTRNSDGSYTIPKDSVGRWMKQVNTSYEDLSEKEQESDRKEARTMLGVINKKTISSKKESVDLAVSLNKVFENKSNEIIEAPDSFIIEDDIRTALGRNINKEIFEAMF